ncbi:hypothetical protein ABFS82_12G065300 [Erythranthe guttata]
MGLKGKLVSQIDIKSEGDVFHEIFSEKQHHVSFPDSELRFTRRPMGLSYGKERVAKEIIEAIDEEKKSVTYKVIEGDLMELYKTFKLTVHVDTSGDDNLVTWTFEYEKLNEDISDPHTLMDFCLAMTKDIGDVCNCTRAMHGTTNCIVLML